MTNARVRLQVDVGFGDAVTPEAMLVDIPPLLDFPAPRLRAYPRETVVAEKLEAMVKLGMANSRMKDFYDIAVLARSFSFDGELLTRAIRATFERRKTSLPSTTPVALTATFAEDSMKKTQWSGFVRRVASPVGRLSRRRLRPFEPSSKRHCWQQRARVQCRNRGGRARGGDSVARELYSPAIGRRSAPRNARSSRLVCHSSSIATMALSTPAVNADIQNSSVRKSGTLVKFYINEHNTKMPHPAFGGQTPDEMFFGTGAKVPEELALAKSNAGIARLVANRAISCQQCLEQQAPPPE